MKSYLSKSDFKLARTCGAKLYYKKHQYPSSTEGNDYLELLAEGGYMIGKMAQLVFDGIEVKTESGSQYAIEETEKLLAENENITLFEPAIESKGKLIRIDVLVKKGNSFQLIEVKSKSYSSVDHAKKGNAYFNGKWAEYLEDVAFQKFTLQDKFPGAEIQSCLMMPDKDIRAEVDGMPHWFTIHPLKKTASGFQGYDVQFHGDIEELRKYHHLEIVPVDDVIEPMMPTIQNASVEFIKSLEKDEKIEVQISANCKDCEFRTSDENSGFKECWGKMADTKPHILSLGQLGNVNRHKGYENCINELIEKGKSSLKDVPIGAVTYENEPDRPFFNNRPYYQITEENEFLKPEFNSLLNGSHPDYKLEYPLHFIDFETSQMALPYHKGMHAYEKVMFQWSCHSLEAPGAELKHSEWINTDDIYPNYTFAKTLMEATGAKGSLMTWSPYENTQLNTVLNHLLEHDVQEPELIDWLNQAANTKDGTSSRIIDMNKLALWYYFHPMMGGRTSIKVTLPSVLSVVNSRRVNSWLEKEELYAMTDAGGLKDPYQLLPQIEIMDRAESVKDGSGAMSAYQDMMYGKDKNDPKIKKLYKNALLRYCKLDTLAMVIIWEHWMHLAKNNK